MNPREKANELVLKFTEHVNPYIGSSMLSNTTSDDAILYQSKKCAQIAVDVIISSVPLYPQKGLYSDSVLDMTENAENYWKQVKHEIETLTVDDITVE